MPSAAPSKSELRLLRPSTRCATITPRPVDFKSPGGGGLSLTGGTHYTPKIPENVTNTFLTSLGDIDSAVPQSTINPNFHVCGEELLSQLKDKVKSHHQEIKQAFQLFDVDRSSFVNLKEFRKVVENFIFPLTDSQFDELTKRVDGITNQRLNYNQFLFKINKCKREAPSNLLGKITPTNDSLDNVVRKLQDQLQQNGPKITKALRMFDTHLDNKIRKSDLKRVLDTFAFRISKDQFERLYKHYDMTQNGTMDYMRFLRSVSNTTLPIKPGSVSPTNTALVIYEEEEAEKKAEEELKEPVGPLWCETVPLVEVEIKLRNKIKHRIQLFYRTFKSMDINSNGYITIEQLRRALEKFTFPMTDTVFERLMERMEIKAKHNLRYEAFLYKLQDRRVGGYGQGLVLKPNHRYHPVIESSEEPDIETLLDKLKSKIVNGYSSIKQAFLVFDETKSGKILKKDFKNVIDGFCFRMSDSQFNKLMSIVDPMNYGYVTYQHFFKLFEDTESSGAHKWLNSVHRVNKAKEPKYLDDAEFEELLAKKISDEQKMVAIAFNNFDREKTGSISKYQLRKFLERFSIPFSKAQFDKLVRRCTENSDGTVNFYEFMKKAGVDLQVLDAGYSNKIHRQNSAAEFDRFNRHKEKLEIVAQHALDHTGKFSVDQILQQLQDYLHQRAADIRKLFIRFDEDNAGRIKRSQFRRFLVKAGFLMDDKQFKELCDRMKIGKSLTYQDFLEHFQTQDNGMYVDKCSFVPKIVAGAPVKAMTCDDGLSLLRTKIQNSYRNLRKAFHAIDRDSDGIINRTDLVAVLTTLLIPMTRESINEMWVKIAKGKKRINVQEFVSFFEETESVENHKWLVSVHHSNSVIPPENMTGDAALNTFRMKALDQYSSLNRCFIAIDRDGKGRLSKKKLKQALQDFCIPISDEEFLKLWRHFDDDKVGFVDHEKFVRRAAEVFNPGDDNGTSTNIVQESMDKENNFNTQQMCRRDELLMNQINTLECLSNEEIEKLFRQHIQDHYCSLRTAFNAADKEQLGYLRKSDLRRVLFDLNFLINDDQFNHILKKCGMENKSRLSYEKFLKFFESPQYKDRGIENFESSDNKIAPYIAAYPNLTNEEAEARMRYCISEIEDVLLQAFGAVDDRDYGIVGLDIIRRVLDNFCFIMTDKQFKFLSKNLPYVSDGRVDYKQFIKSCSTVEEDSLVDLESFKKESRQWLDAVLGSRNGARSSSSLSTSSSIGGRLSRRSKSCTNLLATVKRPETAPFVNADHVEHKIDFLVREKWMDLHKFYKQRSNNNTCVSTEMFQKGLEQAGIVLKPDMLNIICKKYDILGNHQVDYNAFLRKFSALGRVSRTGSDGRESQISLQSGRISEFSYNMSRASSCTSLDMYQVRPDSARSVSRSLASQMRRSSTRLGDLTPGPGIEPPHYVIESLTSHVVRNWKELRKLFKSYDKKNTGWVSTNNFRNCMRANHIDISESDFSQLVTFYQTHSAGKVHYNDFLRAFLSITTVD